MNIDPSRYPLACFLGLLIIAAGCDSSDTAANNPATTRPTLSVTIIEPALHQLPQTLSANGSVRAWQEAIIGAEVSGLRLAAVNAQVGDTVHKGQVLALFADDSVQTEVAQSRALLAEAEAAHADASLNADRARKISSSIALSAQQIGQYLTGEKTALARVASAKAALDAQRVRLQHTMVIASDDGVISARNATLGAVAAPGQELFRLIRQNRLEWQAEVTASEISRLKADLPVSVTVPDVGSVTGVIRSLAPSLDLQSRNGLVYVDLPDAAAKGFRSGMFARGEFELNSSDALTVPQDALSLREGFSYVFRLSTLNGDLAKVEQVKVQLGRRQDNQVEIVSGIQSGDRLVASGAAFLSDGDTVKVVTP
jgi:RND family efflux transporter MFP subunit